MNRFGIFIALMFLTTPLLFAQLSSRSELLEEKYQEERTQGLIGLNRRYIEQFEKELGLAMDARNLDEAKRINETIDRLKAEIAALEKQQTEAAGKSTAASKFSLLAGKTLSFPAWPDESDKLGHFHFEEEGKAFWQATGPQKVARQYKPTRRNREFEVWWPERPDLKPYLIRLSEDGMTAEVYNGNQDSTVTGTIKYTEK